MVMECVTKSAIKLDFMEHCYNHYSKREWSTE